MSTAEYERAFDQVFQDDGGWLDISRLDPWLQAIILERKRLAQQFIDIRRMDPQVTALGKMPYVYFDFIDNLILNAYATIDEGQKELIGVNLGTLLLIHDLFNCMLAHKEILPHVGNPDMEEDPQVPPPFMVADEEYGVMAVRNSDVHTFEPMDPVRGQYADTLFSMAMEFVVAHELAHHRYGHVSLYSQNYNILAIEEVRLNLFHPEPPLTRQAIEMDADCWATRQGFYHLQQVVQNYGRISEALEGADSPLSAGLFDWLFAVYCFFRMIATARKDSRPLEKRLYPSVRERQFGMFATLHALFDRDPLRDLQARLLEVVPVVAVQAEQAFTKVTGIQTDMSDFEEAASAEVQAQVERRLKHWKEVVRPQLLPLTRANDLAE